MTAPRCTDSDYIDFLLATQKTVTATEAARVQPDRPNRPAHDAFTRLLHRLEPDPQTLWQEVGPLVPRLGGLLLVDDSVLDKPYARHPARQPGPSGQPRRERTAHRGQGHRRPTGGVWAGQSVSDRGYKRPHGALDHQ